MGSFCKQEQPIFQITFITYLASKVYLYLMELQLFRPSVEEINSWRNIHDKMQGIMKISDSFHHAQKKLSINCSSQFDRMQKRHMRISSLSKPKHLKVGKIEQSIQVPKISVMKSNSLQNYENQIKPFPFKPFKDRAYSQASFHVRKSHNKKKNIKITPLIIKLQKCQNVDFQPPRQRISSLKQNYHMKQIVRIAQRVKNCKVLRQKKLKTKKNQNTQKIIVIHCGQAK